MARVIYSAMIDEIRGSIGGTTFQSNQYGFTIKRKQRNQIPPSPTQFLRKASFQGIANQWNALTGANRTKWNDDASTYPQYSKKDGTTQLSGFAIFQRLSLLWAQSGTSLPFAEPSAGPGVFTDPAYTITLVSGVLSVNFSASVISGSHRHFYSLSAPVSDSRQFAQSLPRYIATASGSATSLSTDITSAYLNTFGRLPSVGDRVALSDTVHRALSVQAYYIPAQVITITT